MPKNTDSYSYTNVVRQEVRHTKAGPEVTGPPSNKRKKLKNVCYKNNKGPHKIVIKEESHGWFKEYRCDYCGKCVGMVFSEKEIDYALDSKD